MSRTLKRIHGTGTAGAWVDGDKFKMTLGYTPLRDSLDIALAASFQKNLYVGGSDQVALDAVSAGDMTLLDFVPWLVDNTSGQLTGFTDAHSATLVVQVRFMLRVSGAITLTPKVFYGSSMTAITTVATISGEAACSATNTDYSGSNQIQTIALTLPTGEKYFKAAVTVGGSPTSGSPATEAWARAYFDLYVQL